MDAKKLPEKERVLLLEEKSNYNGGKPMRIVIMVFIFVLLFALPGLTESGLISVKSSHDVKNTADRLENILKEKGMNVFGRINHAEGARKVGQELRPTELVIFGNPKVGTPLMQCGQTAAIDLPQKALIWQDEKGQAAGGGGAPHGGGRWAPDRDPLAPLRHPFSASCPAVGPGGPRQAGGLPGGARPSAFRFLPFPGHDP